MKKKLQPINALAVILVIAVFTPLLLPTGVYLPMLFGLPYTLWMGILVTIVFIILTWCSAVLYKAIEEEEQP